jgi:cysteine desulfuration protein SufE
MSLPAAASQALQAFAACPGWDQRARLQMHWGERLAPLSAEQCRNEHLVQGCASQVWLLGQQHEGRWYFQATSDARLLRGLLALLLARVNGLLSEELAAVDMLDWFSQLGLGRQLSPSRSNGLNAVLQSMRAISQGESV